MKILMLVNWKVEYCDSKPPRDKQPPDYVVKGQPYWFFKYFKESVEVDVVDIHSFPLLERFEKEKLRFYIYQTLKILPKLKNYDLILSHGMQSGVLLSILRRFFPTKAKHVVFEIGSFNSASKSGGALKLMQFASKSINGFIYHTSNQKNYYKSYYPWIISKSKFIPFGTDADFFKQSKINTTDNDDKTILCVGHSKRDWNTLYHAFVSILNDDSIDAKLKSNLKLKLIGKAELSYNNKNVQVIPYVPINQLILEIEKASFCVLPLKEFNYSFGQMTLLQQMSLGKAVIASRVSSLTDYIEDGKTALLYEAESVLDLKVKMELLIMDDKKKQEIARFASLAVKEKFNEKIMAENIESYLFNL